MQKSVKMQKEIHIEVISKTLYCKHVKNGQRLLFMIVKGIKTSGGILYSSRSEK